MDTKSASIIGVIILGVLSAGILLWYVSEHPTTYVKQGAVSSSTQAVTVSTEPKNLDEAAPYYYVKAAYPNTTPLKGTANIQAVTLMKQFEMSTIADFKTQGNFPNLSPNDVQMMGLGEKKESLEISYELKRGIHTISYLFTIHADTLGAHPNTYFHTFTFDTSSGANLSLGMLFAPGTDYLTLVSNVSRKKLPALLSAREGLSKNDVDLGYMNTGTKPDASNFENWYLEGSNLVFVFPPYQVAPYSAGTQTVSLPLSELSSSLNTTYRQ